MSIPNESTRAGRRSAPGSAWRHVGADFKEVTSLLNARERAIGAALIVSTFVNALLNMSGIASIYPVIQLVLHPQALDRYPRIAGWLAALGVTGPDGALILFSLAAVVLVIVKNVYGLGHTYVLNLFCGRVGERVATSLLRDVVHAPYEWLSGQNASVLRDVVLLHVDIWARGALRSGLQLATDFMFLLLSAGLIVASAPLAGLVVSLVSIGIALAVMSLLRPMIIRAAESKRAAVKRAGVIATESISGGRDVRISGAGDYLVGKFVADLKRSMTADIRGRVLQVVPRMWIEIIAFGALIGFLLAAVWTETDRAQMTGLVALYGLISLQAIPAVTRLAVSAGAIQNGLLSVDEISSVRRSVPRAPAAEHADVRGPRDWRALSLEQVTFRYAKGGGAVIGPIDLQIERGRSIGIVGASGSGKSTLADLISGLLEPTSGRLALDGTTLAGDELTRWRNGVGFVAQTPYLLDAGLQENICFGAAAGRIEEGRLQAAVQASGLAALVNTLPGGLATIVGDRGLMLSGGQRQRVAIARALYRNADVLILDEATSALDSITEREVHAAIESLKGAVTLIVIAHRLSTVTDCDEIIVLDEGRIAERGSHAELMASGRRYRQMAELQSLTR
jgi:ABC-type multidrug transport system fused ATPase/permease subunit